VAGSPALRAFARRWMKPLTLAALIAPGAFLVWQLWLLLSGRPNDMGVNPAEYIHHFLGDTALRILLVTLAVSPVRDITGWAPIILIRRRIGIAAFVYAVLHVIAYLWLDLLWSLTALWEDVLKRTYITLGMAAIMLLVPLAITSTNGMIRRLGRSRWQKLHFLIYPLAILAVLHHWLLEKGFQIEPLIHAAILAVLLAWRMGRWLIARRSAPAAA
jgi:methionine sulfoxide reductase heme-binding subunit